MFSEAEIQPPSQWNLGVFFPNLKKNPNLPKKYFFFEDWDFYSVNTNIHTHTSYMVMFSFNLMAIVCVIANLFFN